MEDTLGEKLSNHFMVDPTHFTLNEFGFDDAH